MQGKRGKAAVLLLFLLLLISLALGGGTYYLFQQEKVKLVDLQGQFDDLKRKEMAAQTDLDNSKKLISDLESRISDRDSQIKKFGGDLEKEKTIKEEALTKVEQLDSDLEQQRSLRQDLENKLTQAQEEAQKLRAQIKDLEAKRADLETRLKEMEAKNIPIPEQKNIELGTIVVSPETNAVQAEPAVTEEIVPPPTPTQTKSKKTTSSGLEGKVLTINKEYDFAVINLGNKDGINIGDVFSVYRDKKYLGDIKIEKLHESMSAASVVNDPKYKDLINKIAEGDRVVRKSK